MSFKKEKRNAFVLRWIFLLLATAWGGAFELMKITFAQVTLNPEHSAVGLTFGIRPTIT